MKGDLVAHLAWGPWSGGLWHHLGQRLGLCCGGQTANAASSTLRAFQKQEYVFWACPYARAATDIILRNLPDCVPAIPEHVWFLIPPYLDINARVPGGLSVRVP
eukprot:1145631-Pelagomonas_calceolata.AAC.13